MVSAALDFCGEKRITSGMEVKTMASLNSIFYDMSLEGMESEFIGDVSEIGFAYTSLEGDKNFARDVEQFAKDNDIELSEKQKKELKKIAKGGVILFENDSGSRDVTVYDNKEDFNRAWEAAEEQVSESESEIFGSEDFAGDEDEEDF